MDSLDGVHFFLSSIEEINEIDLIHNLKGNFGLVISDIAPNLTGINAIDIENIYQLNCLTLDTAVEYLEKSSGSFIMKTFQNSMLKSLRKKMELSFKIVQTFKPAASKKQSGEIYLYGAYK
jgi:23S rRNA (uridine2552-2'-O)-methyltransferase